MSQNPFDAPLSDLGPGVSLAGRFDVRRAIADAWHAVISDLSVVIIGGVIFFSLGLASIATVLGFFLFFPVILHGSMKMLLNLHDGIAGYSDLGEAFPRYWSALGDTLVLMLLETLLFAPYLFFAAAATLLPHGALIASTHFAGLLVSTILISRFVFAPFFLVDQDLGAIDAMKASWALTKEQKLATFFLVIASLAIGCVGAACGIGAILSIPIASVMFASAYRQIHPSRVKFARGR